METLIQDMRYGVRMLFKSPTFTVAAALMLTLGIAINTVIFSVVNSVLLRPLPYTDSDRLMVVWEISSKAGAEPQPVASANFIDWREQNQVFEDMTALSPGSYTLTGSGDPEQVSVARVSANFFDLLRVSPRLGRSFTPDEDQIGKGQVVIVSHGLWQRYFGSDPNILGKPLTLNGSNFTVIGVMPPRVNLPGELFKDKVDMWVPLNMSGNLNRALNAYGVIGRLKPGVTAAQAQAEMNTIADGLARQYPETNADRGVKLIPVDEQVIGDIRKQLLILLGAVSLVLLIACANVANLLLARATGRKKEIAIRAAMGAGRMRLVRQLLTESVVLALVGGGLGLLLALWGGSILNALIPNTLSSAKEMSFDTRVFLFTFAVTILTGVVFGLAPALQVSKTNLHDSLKEGGRTGGPDSRSHRVRSMLVVAEVSLAFVLLVGAGLLIMSFIQLQHVDPGFTAEKTLTLKIFLPAARYSETSQIWNFYRQLEQRAAAIPGVKSAGLVSNLPLGGTIYSRSFKMEGQPDPRPGEEMSADYYSVSPTYFQSMGIAMLRGRQFNDQDKEGNPLVAIVGETTAKRLWPNESPLGKRLIIADGIDDPREIIGVVSDVKQIGLEREGTTQLYVSYLQKPHRAMYMVIHTNADPSSLATAVRGQVRSADPILPVSNVRTMEELISNSVSAKRFNAVLLAVFACLALVLASVGIYGVISYTVNQRSPEIGIRIALGAQPRDILKLVIGQGLALSAIGLAVGLAGALALAKWVSPLLFRVSATDPRTYLIVSGTLILVALVACYLPARRATRIDPMRVIRSE